MRRASLPHFVTNNLLSARYYGVFAAFLLAGCVGGGGGGGGGYIYVPCQTDAECNGGTCVNQVCTYSQADSTIDGATSGGTSGADGASSGGLSDGATSSGGTSSGGTSSGGDTTNSSGGSSGGDDAGASSSSSGADAASDECGEDKPACDDDNVCTTDLCAEGKCVFKPAIEKECNDGDACTKDDQCNEKGECKGKGGVCCQVDGDCVSTNPCQIGACNVGSKKCEFYQKPNCCSSSEDCKADGAKPCQSVFCNEFTKTCDVKNKSDGANCEDGDFCTEGDKCVTGICVGPAKSCDDGNKCTSDSCVNGGCVNNVIQGCNSGQCTTGTCCASGNFAAKGTKCGTSYVKVEYQCSGNTVQRRYAYQGCSGSSSSCSSSSANYHYTSWSTYKNCSSGYTCQKSGSSATCVPGGGGGECTSGSCCDVATKTFRPKGYKCGSSIKKTETKCDGTNYVRRRYAYQGCTGGSTVCSSSSSYYHYTNWASYKTCSSTQACYASSTTSAYCTTKKYCSSGTCCDTSKKAIKPKYSKCGTSAMTTQYRCYNGQVQTRKQYYGCTGSSTSCTSSTTYRHWTDWVTSKVCGAGSKCVASGTASATCTGGSGTKQCSSGTCCNVATGKFQAKGTKCGSSILKSEYKCNSAKYGYRRYVYAGCSGTSSSCTTSSAHYSYGSWSSYKTCGYKQTCYVPSQISTSAPTCKTSSYCSSGSCCYTTNKAYQSKYYKCSTSVKQTQYRCYQGKVQYRRAYYGCSGSSTTCQSSSSYYHWTDWITSQTCSSGYVCKESGSTSASCVKDSGGTGGGLVQCTSGTCCNVATKRFKTKGEQCSSSAQKYEYKCSSAGGKTVQRRILYRGCSGYSTTCSTSSANYYAGPWSTYKSCSSSQRCYQASSTSANCITTSSSTGKCTSGTCCTSGYYKPKFTACSTTKYSTQYKCDPNSNKVLRRYAKAGCSGYTTTCSSTSTNWTWDPWTTYKTCSSSQYCKQTSSSSANCYTLPSGT